jgi:hypothetical protein
MYSFLFPSSSFFLKEIFHHVSITISIVSIWKRKHWGKHTCVCVYVNGDFFLLLHHLLLLPLSVTSTQYCSKRSERDRTVRHNGRRKTASFSRLTRQSILIVCCCSTAMSTVSSWLVIFIEINIDFHSWLDMDCLQIIYLSINLPIIIAFRLFCNCYCL